MEELGERNEKYAYIELMVAVLLGCHCPTFVAAVITARGTAKSSIRGQVKVASFSLLLSSLLLVPPSKRTNRKTAEERNPENVIVGS